MPCICNETCKIVALTMLKTPLKIMGMKHLISNVVQSSIEKIFFSHFLYPPGCDKTLTIFLFFSDVNR